MDKEGRKYESKQVIKRNHFKTRMLTSLSFEREKLEEEEEEEDMLGALSSAANSSISSKLRASGAFVVYSPPIM